MDMMLRGAGHHAGNLRRAAHQIEQLHYGTGAVQLARGQLGLEYQAEFAAPLQKCMDFAPRVRIVLEDRAKIGRVGLLGIASALVEAVIDMTQEGEQAEELLLLYGRATLEFGLCCKNNFVG